MGNEAQQSESCWILERYVFVEEMQRSPFGRIGLFRKRQENYDYLMVMSRTVHRQYVRNLAQELQFLTRHRNSAPFLKVYNVFTTNQYVDFASQQKQNRSAPSDIRRTQQSCLGRGEQQQVVNVCMEYLNYSLLDHITFKKRLSQQIWMAEYAYILKQCLAAAQLFDSWHLTYLTLDLFSHYLFISPSGELKALPFKSAFLKEDDSGCECFGRGCMNSKEQSTEKKQIHTYSYIALNKKQSKFVKQIKNLSLELFSTIDLNLDARLRRSSASSTSLLSFEELNQFIKLQSLINRVDSLEQLRVLLQQVQDDFILIGSEANSAANKVIAKQEEISVSRHNRQETGSFNRGREQSSNNVLAQLETNGEMSHYSSLTVISRPSILQEDIQQRAHFQIHAHRY